MSDPVNSESPLVKKVKTVVGIQLGFDETLLSPGSRLVDDLNADPTDIPQIAVTLEHEFIGEDNKPISVSDEEMQQLRTLGEIIAFLEQRGAQPLPD